MKCDVCLYLSVDQFEMIRFVITTQHSFHSVSLSENNLQSQAAAMAFHWAHAKQYMYLCVVCFIRFVGC